MKKYILPEIEICKFTATDIVTLSGNTEPQALPSVTSAEGLTVAAFNSDWRQEG